MFFYQIHINRRKFRETSIENIVRKSFLYLVINTDSSVISLGAIQLAQVFLLYRKSIGTKGIPEGSGLVKLCNWVQRTAPDASPSGGKAPWGRLNPGGTEKLRKWEPEGPERHAEGLLSSESGSPKVTTTTYEGRFLERAKGKPSNFKKEHHAKSPKGQVSKHKKNLQLVEIERIEQVHQQQKR